MSYDPQVHNIARPWPPVRDPFQFDRLLKCHKTIEHTTLNLLAYNLL